MAVKVSHIFCALLVLSLVVIPGHGYSSSQRRAVQYPQNVQQQRKQLSDPSHETNLVKINNDINMISRRGVLRALSTVAVGTIIAQPNEVVAAEGDAITPVYFGVGYVWFM